MYWFHFEKQHEIINNDFWLYFIGNINTTEACKDNEFKCITSGECIPNHMVCDGDKDCDGEAAEDEDPPDGCPVPTWATDPVSCTEGNFLCPLTKWFDNRCLPNVSFLYNFQL